MWSVATTIRQHVRTHETIARISGEEFAVILPDSDASGAMALAERLRVAIESLEWPWHPVTISLGVATSRDDTDTPQVLIN